MSTGPVIIKYLPNMRLIAHRGFTPNQRENTWRAVAEGSAVADEIELDVCRCAGGELVVIHDERVDRVTDGNGRVDDHSLVELGVLHVLVSGERVQRLAELLEEIPGASG